MMNFDAYVQSSQSAYTEEERGGDGLLRAYWFNGDQKMGTRGVFFIPAERAAEHGVVPAGRWQRVNRRFSSGNEEQGFECPLLKLAVVHVRKADVVFDPSGMMQYIARPGRNEMRPSGWSLHVEVLAHVEGIDAPIVVSAKRVKASLALLDVLKTLAREVLDPIKRESRKPIPPYWFWAAVGGAVNDRNLPVYEKTKGAPVTPPTLFLPPGTARERGTAMWVGAEMAQRGEAAYVEYAEWARAPLGGQAESPPPSVNTPRPLGADEFNADDYVIPSSPF